MIKKWTPQAVRKDIISKIRANGEIVGKFVETDARRRLMAITDPAWGAGYRQKLVARLLRYETRLVLHGVIIRVGVAATKKSRHHGFYIELGSSTAPAHPFLRPAVFENRAKIVALLNGK